MVVGHQGHPSLHLFAPLRARMAAHVRLPVHVTVPLGGVVPSVQSQFAQLKMASNAPGRVFVNFNRTGLLEAPSVTATMVIQAPTVQKG